MSDRFDDLCKKLGASVSRRDAIKLSIGATLTAMVTSIPGVAWAQENLKKVDGRAPGKLRDGVTRQGACNAGEKDCTVVPPGEGAKTCCAAGQTCCSTPSFLGACCPPEDPKCCASLIGSSFCCHADEECCSSVFSGTRFCCPKDTVCCTGLFITSGCCPKGTFCILNNLCCPPERVCRGFKVCCPTTAPKCLKDAVVADLEKCCPADSPVLCNGACCKPGQTCTRGQCK